MRLFEVDLVYCVLQQDWGRGRGRHWLVARNHSHIIARQLKSEEREIRKRTLKSEGWIRHEKAWSCVSSHSQGYFAGGCLVNPPSSSVKKEGQKSGSIFFLQFYISSQSSAGYKEKNSQQNTQNPIWLQDLKRCLDLEKWAKIRTRKNWIQDNWVQKVQMKKIDHKWVKEVSRNVDHIISDWLESLQQPRPWPSAQPELELEHATDQFKKQKDDTGLFWRTNRSLSNNGPFNTDI